MMLVAAQSALVTVMSRVAAAIVNLQRRAAEVGEADGEPLWSSIPPSSIPNSTHVPGT